MARAKPPVWGEERVMPGIELTRRQVVPKGDVMTNK